MNNNAADHIIREALPINSWKTFTKRCKDAFIRTVRCRSFHEAGSSRDDHLLDFLFECGRYGVEIRVDVMCFQKGRCLLGSFLCMRAGHSGKNDLSRSGELAI